MATSREEMIRSLRSFATFLEENPEVPTPDTYDFQYSSLMAWSMLSKDQLATIAKSAAKHGYKVNKEYQGNYFDLTIGNPDGLTFRAFVTRDTVCRKVDTGRVETYKTYPENIEFVERERPVYEWVCDEPLLSGGE